VKYAGAGVVIVAGAAAGAYYATRPAAPPGPTETTAATTGVTENIELHVIGEALPPLEGLNKIKDIYEGEHPGVKIVIEPYEFESLLQKSTADLAAGTGQYDCVMSIYYNLGKYAENGWVVPIDEFLADPTIVTAEEYKKITDGMIPGALNTHCEYHGKIYGLPFSCQTQFEWYRGDIFNFAEEKDNFKAQYGYPLDHCKTWKEWRDQSEFFTRKKGETLMGNKLDYDFFGTCLQAKRHPCTWYEFICIFPSFGGRLFDEQGNIVINSRRVADALDYYKSLIPFSPPGVLEYTWDDALIAAQQGLLYHQILWYDASYAVIDPAQSKTANVIAFWAPFPVSDLADPLCKPSHSEGGWSFLVNAHSKWPKEACKFVVWTNKPDIQILWARNAGLSAQKAAYEDPEVAALPITRAAYYGNLNSAFTTFGIWPKEPWAEEGYDKAVLAVSNATSGRMTTEQALDGLADDLSIITKKPVKEYLKK
jgi:multiple sugar transport system substrate-binding protein